MITKTKKHLFGLIKKKHKKQVYVQGRYTEHYTYKGASYCGKCRSLNGYIMRGK